MIRPCSCLLHLRLRRLEANMKMVRWSRALSFESQLMATV